MGLTYQSSTTPQEEHPYPTEGLLHGISCLSHNYELSNSYANFKKKIKIDQAVLDKLSLEKESWLFTNKTMIFTISDQFIYLFIYNNGS